MKRARLTALGLAAAVGLCGCSSAGGGDHDSKESGVAPDPTCGARAEAVSAGLQKVSAGGYVFELTALEPALPVQSAAPPGNTWTESVTDPAGAPVTGGTLFVTSYMPDHTHSGPPAVGVEQGGGVYVVDGLVLPMPAFYAITSTLTLESGAKESVAVSLCLSTS